MSKRPPNMLKPCRCRDPDAYICARILTSEVISPYRYCRIYGELPLKQHDFEKILMEEGWRFARQRHSAGSHAIWEKDGVHMPLSWSKAKDAPKNFMRNLAKKFGIPLEKLLNMPIKKGSFIASKNPAAEGTLGRRIYEGRREAGMGQEAFGDLFGVSGSLVGFWESNQTHPGEDRLGKMAELFGWEDMLRVVKPVTANIVIEQSGPLPTQISNEVVTEEDQAEAPHVEPAKNTGRHPDFESEAARKERLAKEDASIGMPSAPGSQAQIAWTLAPVPAIVPAAVESEARVAAKLLKTTPATLFPKMSETEKEEVADKVVDILRSGLTASAVSDWIFQLAAENQELKDRIAEYASMGDLQTMAEKARKWDKLQEMLK